MKVSAGQAALLAVLIGSFAATSASASGIVDRICLEQCLKAGGKPGACYEQCVSAFSTWKFLATPDGIVACDVLTGECHLELEFTK